MKKNVLIITSIVVILGIFIAIMFANKGMKSGGEMPGNQAMDSNGKKVRNQNNSSESFTGTLKDLVSRGQAMTCTYSSEIDGAKNSGTVFVSGENVYGEFKTELPDGTSYESNMIRKDDYAYMWSPQQPQGTMIKIDEAEEMNEEYYNDSDQEDSFDINDVDADYKCTSWKVDNSKFNPPTDIEFIDLNQQMQNMGIDCSVCDSLPAGDGQEQCKQSLGC